MLTTTQKLKLYTQKTLIGGLSASAPVVLVTIGAAIYIHHSLPGWVEDAFNDEENQGWVVDELTYWTLQLTRNLIMGEESCYPECIPEQVNDAFRQLLGRAETNIHDGIEDLVKSEEVSQYAENVTDVAQSGSKHLLLLGGCVVGAAAFLGGAVNGFFQARTQIKELEKQAGEDALSSEEELLLAGKSPLPVSSRL